MKFDESLNQERLNDFFPIPTEEELLKYKNGAVDNILTGKSLSQIFEYIYKESDYLFKWDFSSFERAGYKLEDISDKYKNGEKIYRVVFSDNSMLEFWHL